MKSLPMKVTKSLFVPIEPGLKHGWIYLWLMIIPWLGIILLAVLISFGVIHS